MTIHEYKTRTGAIFADTERRLEFLYVGDYGKEANIKANFLGLDKAIYGVRHTDVDLSNKLVLTISTQKGCPEKCLFCDCPAAGFQGNASYRDLLFQIEYLLNMVARQGIEHVNRLNVHYARMGEPSWNWDVIDFSHDLPDIANKIISCDVVHPVFTTMLPAKNRNLLSILHSWCHDIKNTVYSGDAGLQLSINSTDEEQRNWLFANRSLSLTKIVGICESLPAPRGRRYTLNFPVTKSTILDAKWLTACFDRDKFIVKITPIHETRAAKDNAFDITSEYSSYDVYGRFERPLLECGWDVIVFVPSKEEDEDRITCGNALIATL